MNRNICIILYFLCSWGFTLAQELPVNPNWQSEEDFMAAEMSILEKILWLEQNPMATAANDTKAISEYVLYWLSNTKYMSVTFDEVFLEGLSNNKKYKFGEKFRVTYLFGKSYYILTHKDSEDENSASARGITGMVTVYKELKKIDPSVKHRVLEKYSRLIKSDRLQTFVDSQLAKVNGAPL